jgi:ABC-type sugar transport system permease subunit
MAQTSLQAGQVATTPQAQLVRKKYRRTLRDVLKANSGFLFIIPAIVIFLVFGLYTVIYSVVLSFFRWNGFGGFSILPPSCQYPGCQFAGLENYQEFLYKNPTASAFFWQGLGNNLIMMVAVTVGTVVIALPLAVALNRAVRGQAFFRLVIMLPMVTAGIAIYYVWTFIYNSDGLLNAALKLAGLGVLQAQAGWLGDPTRALGALILVMIWAGVPITVLLYLAGLQTISKDLYEAAALDGASTLQKLWLIIWPLLRPVTVIVVILTINSTLQQSYEMVYLMTNGGPAGHTSIVGLQIFNYGFGDQRQLGIASAMAWLLFIGVFGLALLNLRVFRSKD